MVLEGGSDVGDGRVVGGEHLNGCCGVSREPVLRVETGLSLVCSVAALVPEVLSEEEREVVGDGLVGDDSVPVVDVVEKTPDRAVLLVWELGNHNHGSGAEKVCGKKGSLSGLLVLHSVTCDTAPVLFLENTTSLRRRLDKMSAELCFVIRASADLRQPKKRRT